MHIDSQVHSLPLTVTVFYTACLSFLGGVLYATIVSVAWPTILWLMLMVILLAFFWRRSTGSAAIPWLFLSVALLGFVCGVARLTHSTDSFGHSPLTAFVGEAVELSGVVVREPDERQSFTQLYVAVEEDIILVSVDRYVFVQYGDLVRVSGVLKKPESFTTDLGRTFNYPGYLLRNGVEFQISFATVTVEGAAGANPLLASLLRIKQQFVHELEMYLPEPLSGLSTGLLLGVKQALGKDLEAAFRETGIIHIVVLSGYNIMLIVVFVMYVLGYVLPVRPRIIVGVVTIILFALMVGLSATVVRASIMAILVIVAQAFGRHYMVLRGLLLAGVLMVLANPLILVYDIGFQLSFMATLGLILIVPLLAVWCRFPGWLAPLGTFFYATLATQIAVLPLIMYYMGEVSVVAVLVNILVLPMVPVAMLFSSVVAVCGLFIPVVASLVAVIAAASLQYIIVVAQWFAALPFAAFSVPVFPFGFVVTAYFGLGGGVWWLSRRLRVFGVSELGEELLARAAATVGVQVSPLADWTIEEEREVSATTNAKVGVTERVTPTTKQPRSDTPIFFR